MWENTDRSITAISKFDDISRSVIHSRVVLLNEALQREMESSHKPNKENEENYEHVLPKNLSFYLMEKKVLESSEEDDIHEELSRRLEEMVILLLNDIRIFKSKFNFRSIP